MNDLIERLREWEITSLKIAEPLAMKDMLEAANRIEFLEDTLKKITDSCGEYEGVDLVIYDIAVEGLRDE